MAGRTVRATGRNNRQQKALRQCDRQSLRWCWLASFDLDEVKKKVEVLINQHEGR
jgi:hypothetical protein